MNFLSCVDNLHQELFTSLSHMSGMKMSFYEKVGTYEFALFSYDEKVIKDICEQLEMIFGNKDAELYAMGSDGKTYSLSSAGVKLLRKNKGGLLYYKIKVFLLWLRISNDARIYRKDKKLVLKLSTSRVIERRKTLFFPTFARVLFKDSQNTFRHFRLYEPKGDGKFPLIIYLHGAGPQIGSNNWMHMFEYGYVNRGLKKKKRKKSCYIAVSQLPLYEAYGNPSHAQYLTELIDFIESKGNLDKSRIYIIGTSRGGYGVFRQLVMLPNTFAAAIACAGFMNFKIGDTSEHNNSEAYKKIAMTPLWLEHSCDDDDVLVNESDTIYENLKSLGADVRYTRDTKGKHFAHRRFYKSGIWVDWLFKNRR